MFRYDASWVDVYRNTRSNIWYYYIISSVYKIPRIPFTRMFTKSPSVASDELFYPLDIVSNSLFNIIKESMLSNYYISDDIIDRKMEKINAKVLSLKINHILKNNVIHKWFMSIQDLCVIVQLEFTNLSLILNIVTIMKKD